MRLLRCAGLSHVSVALLVLALTSALQAAPPNVMVIIADDLGYSDVGCYGSEIATPHLDSLAANGLRFTSFYNTARCWPSRSALMTGYYAQQIRRDTIPKVPSGGRGVRPAWAPLLSTMLRGKGYRNYHSGKWHIDGEPMENGFDHSYDMRDQGRFFSPRTLHEDGKEIGPILGDSGYYATVGTADHAIKCLREHAQEHADRPFFSYLAFIAPHFPLHALPEDIALYQGKYDAGWGEARTARWGRMNSLMLAVDKPSDVESEIGPPYHFPDDLLILGPGEVNRPLPWSDLNEQQQKFQAAKMEIHAAMVDRMDREIGRVLDQLKAMNAFDNTLILFLSDNGASAEIMVRADGHDPNAVPGSAATHLCLGPGWSNMCNTPFRRHKTWVHEGGIATPLIAHWPRGIAAHGELRHEPGHVIDIVPTVLELAGASKPGDHADALPLPGKSLVPVFGKDHSIERESLWWCHEENRAIRIGNYKLVAAKGDPWELYDISIDRAETSNLASSQPDRVESMAAAWQKIWDEAIVVASKDVPEAPAPGRRQQNRKPGGDQ